MTTREPCTRRRKFLLSAAMGGMVPPLPQPLPMVLLLMPTLSLQAAETLVITAVNKSGASAVAARLLAEIYRRAGLGLQVEVLPPPRAGQQTAQGGADGELVRIQSYGEDHPQLVRVEPAFYRATVRAYSLRTSYASVTTTDDVRHYTTGAIRGMAYVAKITEGHPAVTLTQSPLQLFRMLAAGRVELALATSLGAQSALLKLGLKDVVASPELVRFELFHYLHAGRRDLAPKLGLVIKKMRDSGELELLTRQYEAAVAAEEVQAQEPTPAK